MAYYSDDQQQQQQSVLSHPLARAAIAGASVYGAHLALKKLAPATHASLTERAKSLFKGPEANHVKNAMDFAGGIHQGPITKARVMEGAQHIVNVHRAVASGATTPDIAAHVTNTIREHSPGSFIRAMKTLSTHAV